MNQALQDLHIPDNVCFGCGPEHPDGLRLKSRPVADGEGLVAEWTPADRFQGPPGIVNGGLLSVPMDCHSAWTAMAVLTRRRDDGAWVHVVTAEYRVRLRRPTPTGTTVRLRSHPGWVDGRRTSVRTTARVGDETTAELEGVFAAVDHRTYHLPGAAPPPCGASGAA